MKTVRPFLSSISDILLRYSSGDSSVAFWHTNIHLNPDPDWFLYPIDLTSKVNAVFFRDSNGIPLLDYKGSIGLQYNPLAISQYAIGCIQSGSPFYKEAILCADWLIASSHLHEDGYSALLPYQFSIAAAGLNSPFYSGLAQAVAYSFFIRLARIADQPKYGAFAKRIFDGMVKPVDSGGFLRYIDGCPVIEEFILDKQSVILDGWLFSIISMVDECTLSRSAYPGLLGDSIVALRRLLPLYDYGYWSKTDLYHVRPSMPASLFYHNLHIIQLSALKKQLGLDFLGDYVTRWSHGKNHFHVRIFYLIYKAVYKLLTY